MSRPTGHDAEEDTAVMITIDAETLETITCAAEHWRHELQEYIIPASRQFDDPESAESQQAEAEAISRALAVAHHTEHTQGRAEE